jgi:hypothetical protein
MGPPWDPLRASGIVLRNFFEIIQRNISCGVSEVPRSSVKDLALSEVPHINLRGDFSVMVRCLGFPRYSQNPSTWNWNFGELPRVSEVPRGKHFFLCAGFIILRDVIGGWDWI